MALVFEPSDFNYSSDYNVSYLDESYYEDSCCGEVCDQGSSMAFDAVFIPTLYTVAVILGILGNVLVLVVLWQKRRSWSVTDTFVLHLSVADILLLLTMPLWAVDASKGWIFGTGLCKLTGTLFRVNFYCGIFLMACISLDRYLSIVHAVQMYSRKKPWIIQLSCMAVWFLSLLLTVPDWMFLQAADDSRRGKTQCVHWYPSYLWRIACRVLYHLVGFILPAMVLLFCYTCILLRLQRGSQRGTQKQRAMQVILVLVVAFFISWTPYNLTLMLDTINININMSSNSSYSSNSCDTSTALDIALTATSTLGYLHCCMNPVLYAFFWGTFRNHVLDMVHPISSRTG
ncbi:C-X-C chemokine receptor type 3-like [Salminus brasiliensis]|uniref:C-X-C chemokine receptor type 3-like n=1 Tax=Salminus brasiliensis TaxID=930266 RepID=UPI003B836906